MEEGRRGARHKVVFLFEKNEFQRRRNSECRNSFHTSAFFCYSLHAATDQNPNKLAAVTRRQETAAGSDNNLAGKPYVVFGDVLRVLQDVPFETKHIVWSDFALPSRHLG
jgi:hypothetical protein